MDDLTNHLQTLYSQASADVQEYLSTDELDRAVSILGKLHSLQIDAYVPFKNTITLTLLGVIQPAGVVAALQKNCDLSEDVACELAGDLEQTIFQKVRLTALGKSTSEVKELALTDATPTTDELRKEILDTTKRTLDEPVVPPSPFKPEKPELGSRSQLLEQLQVLDTIPDDEEIEARLNTIKQQISSIDKKKDANTLDSNIALQEFMFGEKGKDVANATVQAATYSKAPTQYNVDPYRELSEE